jgi:hypothetical protein
MVLIIKQKQFNFLLKKIQSKGLQGGGGKRKDEKQQSLTYMLSILASYWRASN